MKYVKNKFLIATAVTIFLLWLAIDLSAGWLTAIQGIPAGDYYLNSFQVWSAKRKAKDGDLQAIGDLVDYYSVYRSNMAEAYYWMQRGVDAGDLQYNKFLPPPASN